MTNADPFAWNWEDNLVSDDDPTNGEPTSRPRRRPMIEGIHVRDGFDPDELLLVPVDTPDSAVSETWVLASGDESFVDLEDWR